MSSKINTNNLLSKETSPYLLQHANNPVNWVGWSSKVLNKAKEDNKLILISIGYAACHWCHVMEHESFEDISVAEVMNANFINIKVDREERPDVDQVYMKALQLMTGQGGWPLNIVALPDGRPIWGATYLPKKQWKGSLHQLADLYRSNPEHMVTYAEKLSKGMAQVSLVTKSDSNTDITKAFLKDSLKTWSNQFDYTYGGTQRSPKFMMPNNYQFLLRYAHQTKDKSLLDYVILTLNKISYGGVYDHIGGGFSRYAVDSKWHVPHFEKMLYDNAQLVSLYSKAYTLTKDPWYKIVVTNTLNFIETELTRDNGSFYSSLDADSLNTEGKLEEGAFYVWTKAELKLLLNEDYPLFEAYYNINEYGHWEHNNYVLIRTKSNSEIANDFSIPLSTLDEKLISWKALLNNNRQKRAQPRLDDKSLTSWNALMINGYIDAYKAFQINDYLEIALKASNFILDKMLQKDGSLTHSYNKNEAKINGYLEDYAFTIEAFISLFEVTFNSKWLSKAEELTTYALKHFYDEEQHIFYFNSNLDDALVTRPIEQQDNVIPASNSTMAKNLFKLSHLLGIKSYKEIAEQQLKTVLQDAKTYASGYSNWLDVIMNFSFPYHEIVITGKNASNYVKDLNLNYIPNSITAATEKENNDLLIFKNRYEDEQTLIYVCKDNTCNVPTDKVSSAVKQCLE